VGQKDGYCFCVFRLQEESALITAFIDTAKQIIQSHLNRYFCTRVERYGVRFSWCSECRIRTGFRHRATSGADCRDGADRDRDVGAGLIAGRQPHRDVMSAVVLLGQRCTTNRRIMGRRHALELLEAPIEIGNIVEPDSKQTSVTGLSPSASSSQDLLMRRRLTNSMKLRLVACLNTRLK
jgi:hypothetical protein